MAMTKVLPVAMTVAGSDSGAGAGIQADLKTFRAMDVFGVSVITCITAQNPDEVRGVEAISPELVRLQMATVCDGFPVAALKTGMLYSSGIIAAVAAELRNRRLANVVVDPVMVATSGARLLRDDAVDALRRELLPLATVLTPNLPEAEILCGHEIRSPDEQRAAAEEIGRRFNVACVVKGGHAARGDVLDVLYVNGGREDWSLPRVDRAETHGTGCTFSAAVAGALALGETLPVAVGRAKMFVTDALRSAPRVGDHRPLGS